NGNKLLGELSFLSVLDFLLTLCRSHQPAVSLCFDGCDAGTHVIGSECVAYGLDYTRLRMRTPTAADTTDALWFLSPQLRSWCPCSVGGVRTSPLSTPKIVGYTAV